MERKIAMEHLTWVVRTVIMSVAVGASALAGGYAQAADNVTLVTDFGFNGRHAYYYYALEKGYYKDAGIDLTIVRGQGSVDAVKQVAAGTAQLGFADTSAVIFGRANDGIPVKLVAVIYAKPPHAIYVLKESGITKPKDLEGRSVADTAFSAVPKMFAAYAKAAGIDASKVKWIVAGSDSLPGMLSLGRVDGIGQYTVGEPLLKKAAAPKEITKLAYADAGLNFYGAGLIATENTIKTQPDMIRRFVLATMRGLKDACAKPNEAGQIMNKYHKNIDVDVATGETEMVCALALVPNIPPGFVSRDGVQRTIDVVAGAFDLKKPVTVDDVFAPGFVGK
jgi:NitT/TauT family transport system substrate-binding protein